MGHILHHAIVVTSGDETVLNAARQRAIAIGCSVTPVVESAVNGYGSFLVGTDGSKTGWGDSEAGDDQRDEFVSWLASQRYADLSSLLEWCEVQYGSDDAAAKVTRHEWQNTKSSRPSKRRGSNG